MKNQAEKMPRISIFHRKPQEANFSIERLFHDITSSFPHNIAHKSITSRFESRGFLRRVYNIIEAFYNQSDINHITGDVHYLSYLLPKNNTLLTIHDCVSLERLHGVKKAIFYFFWYWLPVKRVSVITVVSESTKKELLRYVKCDESKIRVVLNCISDSFKQSPKKFNHVMPVLLQIGTGNNKNISKVAEAISGIPCHLRIIGKLSKEQISKLDKYNINYSAVFNLSDANIINEYFNCDVLIFVSTYEGFGLPIVEANAIGRPVITSNILSMPEVAGNAACFVNPFDVHEIRNGVLKILTDESYRNSLISNGYMNAQKFNSTIIANQYLAIYKEMYLQNNQAIIEKYKKLL